MTDSSGNQPTLAMTEEDEDTVLRAEPHKSMQPYIHVISGMCVPLSKNEIGDPDKGAELSGIVHVRERLSNS